MSPDLFESLRQSPYTPWIGTGLLIIVGLSLIKLVARSGAKLIVLLLLAAFAVFGYQWWGQPGERELSDIKNDWFSSFEETDFSRSGLERLTENTGKLIKEAGAITQEMSREQASEALQSISKTLQEKLQQAKESGKHEAVEQIERLHEKVMESLRR